MIRSKIIHAIYINLNGARIDSPVVYRIDFSSGNFYIGSTINFWARLSAYLSAFSRGYVDNKKIKEELIDTKSITFNVIEIVSDPAQVKYREDEYLKNNHDHPNSLNRAKSAFSNAGIKWTRVEKDKVSLKTKGVSKPGRPTKIPNRKGYHYVKVADRVKV